MRCTRFNKKVAKFDLKNVALISCLRVVSPGLLPKAVDETTVKDRFLSNMFELDSKR